QRGIFEEQQGQGAGGLATQVGSVLVDLVVQLARDALHLAARFLADQRAVAQRARNRRLGDSGQMGDIERDGLAFDLHASRVRWTQESYPRDSSKRPQRRRATSWEAV